MKFNIVTFGCKVNQYESNMMKENMLHHNFLHVEDMEDADIIIVNTCTVTSVADKKCLKMIRRIKRECPDTILVVAGCSVEGNSQVYEELNPNILIGNSEKNKIGKLVSEYISSNTNYIGKIRECNKEFEDTIVEDSNHVRAYIKIEDGCQNFCSYCIIPYVRGPVVSKSFDKIIEEAVSLANTNHLEIILTGIHTGHYNDSGKDLTDLIRELSKIDGIKRIRISSIEVTELNDKFLTMLASNEKVCNHLHIPLQAGSDEVLKRMNRKYDTAYFEEKINKIRSIRPDISISTDIIVGHPYETDELFKKSLEFARSIGFSKIHVFPYSKREGTPSASMPEQVSDTEKKHRVNEMIKLSNELEENYYNKFRGEQVDILVEEIVDGKSIGHTSNYLKVELSEELEVGKIYERQL